VAFLFHVKLSYQGAFMKTILLIVLAMTISSCNNSNKTAEKVNLSAYQKKAFLSFPHDENGSVLRNKLLNLQLTKELNLNDESTIDGEKDYFNFNNEIFTLSSAEAKDYLKQQKLSAEIIVSYKDHLDFYFVPAGLTSDLALSELGLNTEDKNELTWAMGKPSLLGKGQVYFLINADKKELLRNDFNFFHFRFKDSESVSSAPLTYRFTNNQKVILRFHLNLLLKQTSVAEVRGQNRSCKKDEREAGYCFEPCTARIESDSGTLISQQWTSEKIPMSFMINGKLFNAEDLNIVLNLDHTLTLELEFSKYTREPTVDFQVMPMQMPAVLKQVAGYDYSPNCKTSGWLKNTLDLTPQVQNVFQIDVFGREMKI
jgi:hypothetical protein